MPTQVTPIQETAGRAKRRTHQRALLGALLMVVFVGAPGAVGAPPTYRVFNLTGPTETGARLGRALDIAQDGAVVGTADFDPPGPFQRGFLFTGNLPLLELTVPWNPFLPTEARAVNSNHIVAGFWMLDDRGAAVWDPSGALGEGPGYVKNLHEDLALRFGALASWATGISEGTSPVVVGTFVVWPGVSALDQRGFVASFDSRSSPSGVRQWSVGMLDFPGRAAAVDVEAVSPGGFDFGGAYWPSASLPVERPRAFVSHPYVLDDVSADDGYVYGIAGSPSFYQVGTEVVAPTGGGVSGNARLFHPMLFQHAPVSGFPGRLDLLGLPGNIGGAAMDIAELRELDCPPNLNLCFITYQIVGASDLVCGTSLCSRAFVYTVATPDPGIEPSQLAGLGNVYDLSALTSRILIAADGINDAGQIAATTLGPAAVLLSPTPNCGNGIPEAGEGCDEGSMNGAATSCCTVSCQPRNCDEMPSNPCTSDTCTVGTGCLHGSPVAGCDATKSVEKVCDSGHDCTVTSLNSDAEITIPAGCLPAATHINVVRFANGACPTFFSVNGNTTSKVVTCAEFLPATTSFTCPVGVRIRIKWRNDTPGNTCDVACPACANGGPLQEGTLRLMRNGKAIAPSANRGCGTSSATSKECPTVPSGGQPFEYDCNYAPDPGFCVPGSKAACDVRENFWEVWATKFSEYAVATETATVLTGTGPVDTDCALEWRVIDPQETPDVDRRGLPNPRRSCVDGDPSCDGDGVVNGSCAFAVAACLNMTDERLPVCASVDVAGIQLRRPSPADRSPAIATAGRQLHHVFEGLGTYLGSPDGTLLQYQPVLTTPGQCTDVAHLVVPLEGRRQRTLRLSVGSTSTSGTVDRDGLKLRCKAS